MPLALKRIYEEPSPEDGYRVLVDRLWPRGISKEKARLDGWLKEIAPSDHLRRWVHEDPDGRWGEFRRRYLSDLAEHREELRPLAERAREGRVTLLYASKDEERNNAVVVKEYLEQLGDA